MPTNTLIPNVCAHMEGGGYCELLALPWNACFLGERYPALNFPLF